MLDLGCGRGGDLCKYARLGVARVVGVDVSTESLVKAAARADQLAGTFEFYQRDLEDPAVVAELEGTYDLVSFFFSAQYMLPSREAAAALMASLARLAPDGAVVLAIPDDQLVSALPPGPLARVERRTPAGPDGWGGVYEFSLVGAIDRCPEYGVPTAALLDEARAAGWRVDLAATFDTLADLDPTLRSAMSADAPLTPVERDVVGVYVACILSRGAALDPQECAEHDDQGPGRHQPGNQKQGWTEDAFHLTTGGEK